MYYYYINLLYLFILYLFFCIILYIFICFVAALRFGKSVDILQSAYKSMLLDDYAHKFTIVLAKLNQAAFLLIDHWIWLGRVGLVKTDVKKWMRVAARFWLYFLSFNLLRNLYDLLNAYQNEALRARRQQAPSSDGSRRPRTTSIATKVVVNHKPVVIDSVKNICDVMLPLSSLGYISTTPGFQGLAGMISSVLGILITWNSRLKLIPS